MSYVLKVIEPRGGVSYYSLHQFNSIFIQELKGPKDEDVRGDFWNDYYEREYDESVDVADYDAQRLTITVKKENIKRITDQLDAYYDRNDIACNYPLVIELEKYQRKEKPAKKAAKKRAKNGKG